MNPIKFEAMGGIWSLQEQQTRKEVILPAKIINPDNHGGEKADVL